MTETTMQLLPRDKMTREWRWGVPLILALIAVDQLTKAWVMGNPAFNAMNCLSDTAQCGKIEVSGVFDFSMIWNRGVSFGALQAEGIARWGLFAMIGVIAVGFTVWLFRAERWMTALALSMVVGGAVGNLIDRARFGAVVDFLDFQGLFFPWVFNVADACISIGAVALLLDQLLAGRKTPS
jgi:signal peptidase II